MSSFKKNDNPPREEIVRILRAVMNPIQTNCYVLKEDGHALIFDPSADDYNNIDRIVKKIENDQVDGICLTHGHIDHISAVDLLVAKYNCPVYILNTEEKLLNDSRLNGSLQFFNIDFVLKSPINYIGEGKLIIGNFDLEVVAMPGHTSGHCVYIYKDVMFCGDLIFKGSIGRMDLPTGSIIDMRNSLKKLLNYSVDYKLYCGHGEPTNLNFERQFNYYLTSDFLG